MWFFAKIRDILGHKMVKNDFFKKILCDRLDIHEIFNFSPNVGYLGHLGMSP